MMLGAALDFFFNLFILYNKKFGSRQSLAWVYELNTNRFSIRAADLGFPSRLSGGAAPILPVFMGCGGGGRRRRGEEQHQLHLCVYWEG